MTFMFNEPTMQYDNPYFRLWQYIQDCEARHPDTRQCTRFMDLEYETVRYMLQRLQQEGYLFSSTHHREGRGARGAAPSTWYCRDWTSEMINRPFPKPRGWKPPVV